jgi:phosphoserine phosphatase RsbU/P
VRITLSWWIDLIKKEAILGAMALIVAGVLWAIGDSFLMSTVLVYSFALGNLSSLVMFRTFRIYGNRPFPYNWALYLLLALLFTGPIYVVSSVLVWWLAPPSPQTLGHLLKTGWKLPVLVTLVFSVSYYLFKSTRERLLRRNQELQRSIEAGAAKIQQQELDLQRAREIQQSLLPKHVPQLPGFEVAGAWQPARVVSGDYYDVLRLNDHKLGICVADVAGKGVSAALLMANVQAAVRAYAGEDESPAGVCLKVNSLLHENVAVGKFVTFVYGVLDADRRTFVYCNAGNPYPILASAGSTRTLDHSGAVLGVFSEWKYEDTTIDLKPGDRLLLFTDGITEAEDADGREFDENGVASFANANGRLAAKELISRLLARVSEFCGAQFHDDATLLVIAAT